MTKITGVIPIAAAVLFVLVKAALQEDEPREHEEIVEEEDLDDFVEELPDCIEYKSQPGRFRIRGQDKRGTCGLYIIGPVDTRVIIVFEEFDVTCADHGAVEIVDGYAHGKTVFPPQEDRVTGDLRKGLHCGSAKPLQMFLSTGNMALIQHRLSRSNDEFVVDVNFVENPQPCNAVVLDEAGDLVLRNYGREINCSILMIFPQHITLRYVDVGMKVRDMMKRHGSSYALTKPDQRGDSMEILGGNTSSLSQLVTFKHLAGFGPLLHINQDVPCESVMIRLVSTGLYENSVQFSHRLLNVHPAAQHKRCKTPE